MRRAVTLTAFVFLAWSVASCSSQTGTAPVDPDPTTIAAPDDTSDVDDQLEQQYREDLAARGQREQESTEQGSADEAASRQEDLDTAAACMRGEISDFETCYKAGYKASSHLSREAQSEVDAESSP